MQVWQTQHDAQTRCRGIGSSRVIRKERERDPGPGRVDGHNLGDQPLIWGCLPSPLGSLCSLAKGGNDSPSVLLTAKWIHQEGRFPLPSCSTADLGSIVTTYQQDCMAHTPPAPPTAPSPSWHFLPKTIFLVTVTAHILISNT